MSPFHSNNDVIQLIFSGNKHLLVDVLYFHVHVTPAIFRGWLHGTQWAEKSFQEKVYDAWRERK